jgi:hypothetical protein
MKTFLVFLGVALLQLAQAVAVLFYVFRHLSGGAG